MPDIDKEEAETTSTQPAHEVGRHDGQHGKVNVPGEEVSDNGMNWYHTNSRMNWCSPLSKYLHISE